MSEPMSSWGPPNLKTAADVRRMLQGLPPLTKQEGEVIPPTQRVPTSIPSGAVSATVETVIAEPMKTVETVQTIVPDGELSSLDLTPDQLSALEAAGITDRAGLATALEAAGDNGLPGLSRAAVRALRKQLGG